MYRANLTQSDIEALIERSFSIRESDHRAAYRLLQLHNSVIGLSSDSEHLEEEEYHQESPPGPSASMTQRSTSCAEFESFREEDDAESQRTDSRDETFAVERFR
jgi:hypothetical protein